MIFIAKLFYLIDVAIPGDSRLIVKVNEKIERYTDLKIELQRMRKVRVAIVPLIVGCLGSVSKCLVKHLKTLNIYYGTLVSKLQKSVLLNSCHILRWLVTKHI